MSIDREELCRKYAGLSRDIHAASPLTEQIVAQIETARLPESVFLQEWPHERTRCHHYSRQARSHPRLSEAIDAARELRTSVPDARWLETWAGLDYLRSNLPDRKPLECDEDGHELNVHGLDHAERIADYRDWLNVAITGPAGVRCVVLVDPGVPMYTPPLPWGWTEQGTVSPSVPAFPVSYGYSTERVPRAIMHRFASRCCWCESGDADFGLVYSAGATAYVFPTCGFCWWDFISYFNDDSSGLDVVPNDGWDFCTGWPADEHR